MTDEPPEMVDKFLSRRQQYVRALGQYGTQQYVPLLERANADDLRWIVRIVDLQLSEGRPDHVTDPHNLKQIMDDLRIKRSLALSRLVHVETWQREISSGSRHPGNLGSQRRHSVATLILAGTAAAILAGGAIAIGIAQLFFR
jgi:hypothetical protein